MVAVEAAVVEADGLEEEAAGVVADGLEAAVVATEEEVDGLAVEVEAKEDP